MKRPNFGQLERFDKSAVWQVHSHYFKNIGLKAWKYGDVPYTGISNYFEAHKKARLLIDNLKNFSEAQIRVLEIGAGNGEFAKNFLLAFVDICEDEGLDFYDRICYYLTDFSDKTLAELRQDKRLQEVRDKISFVIFDVANKYSWPEEFEEKKFDVIFANYLLDQLPARVIARKINKLGHVTYLEKYLALDDEYKTILELEPKKKNKAIKKLKSKVEFCDLDYEQEINLTHREILDSCFRPAKTSTIVYSYGALQVIKNLLHLLKPSGVLICSDFNASSKPGIDSFDPCYYGNSLAQAVNFEFIVKYFRSMSSLDIEESHKVTNNQEMQMVLIYEDPIKPLHTLIMTRPDFIHSLELGEAYKSVYEQNWLLRAFYRFMVEIKLSFYLFVLIFIAFFFYYFFLQA